MSSSYNILARFYDLLTQNAEYEKRTDYILNLYKKYCGAPCRALDLACGTGAISLLLRQKGCDVTGIDISEDMLAQADAKAQGSVSFIKADMTDFTLPDKYNLCVCSLDGINHLLTPDDVKRCFACVYNALESGGIFIFDVNTLYKHKEMLADNAFVFDEEDFFLSWDNEYEGDGLVRILLDFFVFNGKSYDRYSEEFYERAYGNDELSSALSGFEILDILDDMSENSPAPDSERIYYVCRRKS